jgi:hypothetical protein
MEYHVVENGYARDRLLRFMVPTGGVGFYLLLRLALYIASSVLYIGIDWHDELEDAKSSGLPYTRQAK